MAMSLREWIQAETDQGGSAPQLDADYIDELISESVVRDCRSIESMLNADHRAEIMRTYDSVTRRVTIPLFDMTGDLATYSGPFTYYFKPETFQVLVDGVAADSADYTYSPRAMEVVFDTSLPDGSEVEIRGHLVNMRYGGAMFKAFKSLADRVGLLVSVRGSEFEKLRGRLLRVAHESWGPRSARRG